MSEPRYTVFTIDTAPTQLHLTDDHGDLAGCDQSDAALFVDPHTSITGQFRTGRIGSAIECAEQARDMEGAGCPECLTLAHRALVEEANRRRAEAGYDCRDENRLRVPVPRELAETALDDDGASGAAALHDAEDDVDTGVSLVEVSWPTVRSLLFNESAYILRVDPDEEDRSEAQALIGHLKLINDL